MQLKDIPELDLNVLDAAQPGALGVAVSGGGDSVALLHLLHNWGGRSLAVVTVDHGLRDESREEAEAIAVLARSMGYTHDILTWTDKPRRGNLQDAARTARRSLMVEWAASRGIAAIALGHTADDQAETFLMRLARGSGVAGLSSMEPVREEDGVQWLRPLLDVRRAALRSYLHGVGAEYVDDPSNEDDNFERVRVRQALGTLGALGIDVPNISKTTERLRSAKQVVYAATRDLALACAKPTGAGEIEIDAPRLMSGQASLQLRILSEAVRFVAGSYYAPRAYMVENVLSQMAQTFQAATLHGCIIRKTGDVLSVRREPGKTEGTVQVGQIWDGRWKLTGTGAGEIDALGETGLKSCPDWRETGFSREALLTTPAVWKDGALIAAPLAGWPNGWTAEISLQNPFFHRGVDEADP